MDNVKDSYDCLEFHLPRVSNSFGLQLGMLTILLLFFQLIVLFDRSGVSVPFLWSTTSDFPSWIGFPNTLFAVLYDQNIALHFYSFMIDSFVQHTLSMAPVILACTPTSRTHLFVQHLFAFIVQDSLQHT